MNENEGYIETLTVNDVPWHRLTTPYGRATAFPRYFAVLESMDDLTAVEDALYELTINTEHQGTLWHATPFALVFLVRIFRRALAAQADNEIARRIAERLLEHFLLIAECVRMGDVMEHAAPAVLLRSPARRIPLVGGLRRGGGRTALGGRGCVPGGTLLQFLLLLRTGACFVRGRTQTRSLGQRDDESYIKRANTSVR